MSNVRKITGLSMNVDTKYNYMFESQPSSELKDKGRIRKKANLTSLILRYT